MDEWISLTRMADEIGIPAESCRSYAVDQFGEFITVQRRGLAYRVRKESIPVFLKIHSLFAQGMDREQVRDALTTEFGRVYKIVARSGGIRAEISVQPETGQFLPKTEGEELARAERELDVLKARIAELETSKAVSDDMGLIRATLKALKEDENRF